MAECKCPYLNSYGSKNSAGKITVTNAHIYWENRFHISRAQDVEIALIET